MKRFSINRCSVFWLLLTILWCILIFLFSAQNAAESTAVSDGVLNRLLKFRAAWSPEDSTGETVAPSFSLIVLVRKLAHLSLYLILGVLASATVFSHRFQKKSETGVCWLTAWGFCVFYAVTDEVHQYFVPGRSCRLLDVCIDSLGALLGSLLVLLIVIFHRHHQENGV